MATDTPKPRDPAEAMAVVCRAIRSEVLRGDTAYDSDLLAWMNDFHKLRVRGYRLLAERHPDAAIERTEPF